MKLISEKDVIKVDKDNKRNSKRRYLLTDGICFRCAAIVNYSYEKRCVLCCGSDQFLVGEPSKVLRELLELDIEQIGYICQVRGRNIGHSSRARMTLELFKLIFPRLSNVDNRIDEMFVRKIIYRNRKRFWYVKDIESEIYRIRNKKRYDKNHVVNIKLIDEKDMV